MAISSKALRVHIEHRDLVCVRRAAIDENAIQGFVLDCSNALVLLQRVYDFHLDGFTLLRRRDITELKAGDTDRFQRQLLLSEGVLDRVDFAFRAPIHSFDSFLASRATGEIVIVEDEISQPNRFLIGTVSHIGGGTVTVRHFNGVARLVDLPEVISSGEITSCQTDTNYARFYQNYFERGTQ